MDITFSKKLQNKLLNAVNKKHTDLILIDGISCSGKTFFSDALNSFLKNKGKKTHLVSKDLFLKSRKQRISYLKKIKKKICYLQNSKHYYQNKIKYFINCFNEEDKKIIIKNLYSRKTGLNNDTQKFHLNYKNILIYEGIYCLDDFEKINRKKLKILILRNIYSCLSSKIKRIRDKKISIYDVVLEFTNIHLNSFYRYIKKNNYDLVIDYKNNSFELMQNSQKNYIQKITNFLTMHRS